MINSTDVIATAESAFLNGKRGTFAIVRTPEDGKLWYAAPGVQSDVLLLRMYANGRAIDENSFSGTLIIRSDAKKDQRWFAYYICDVTRQLISHLLGMKFLTFHLRQLYQHLISPEGMKNLSLSGLDLLRAPVLLHVCKMRTWLAR